MRAVPVIMKPSMAQVDKAAKALKAIVNPQLGEGLAVGLIAEILRRAFDMYAVQIALQQYPDDRPVLGVSAVEGECLHKVVADTLLGFKAQVLAMNKPCTSPDCLILKEKTP